MFKNIRLWPLLAFFYVLLVQSFVLYFVSFFESLIVLPLTGRAIRYIPDPWEALRTMWFAHWFQIRVRMIDASGLVEPDVEDLHPDDQWIWHHMPKPTPPAYLVQSGLVPNLSREEWKK